LLGLALSNAPTLLAVVLNAPVASGHVLTGSCVVVLLLLLIPDIVLLDALAQSQLHFLCPRLKEKKRKALIYVYVLARVSVYVYASVRMRMGVC
jgi:hypothetical protein